MNDLNLKIGIIGAGAMGSVFGSMLSSVSDVFLVNPDNEHVREISGKGIIIEKIDKTKSHYMITVYKDYKKAPTSADIAIIFTKSYDTEKAATSAAHIIKKDGIILTLQNGIGNLEIIEKIAGKNKTVLGVTSHGAAKIKSGYVCHAGYGDTFIADNKACSYKVKKTAEIFNKAGIKTFISENLDSIIWGKLIVNAGINALSAILRLKNGILGESFECENIMKNAAVEAANVAQALNITLPFDDPLKQVKKVCTATYNNRASMLQDIISSKKTEIDAINYAIVKKGEKIGIPTPYNRFLSELIKAIEKNYDLRIN
jgi:2-dehydropantoate 2-reductase